MSFKIADGYVEVNARVDENQARAAANKVTNSIGDESERVGKRRGRDFFRAMFTPDRNIVTMLRTGIPAVLGSPVGAAALTLGAMFAASFVGAFISSGVMATIGAGLLGLGAVILKNNKQLEGSFRDLGKSAQRDLEQAAQPLVPAFASALERVQSMFSSHIADPLHKIFQGLAPTVIPLAESIVKTVSNIMNALAAPDVLGGLRDFMMRFAQELPRVGNSIGDLFAKLARESNLMGEGFSFVVSVIENLMNFVGDALVTLTQMGVGFARLWGEVEGAIHPIISAVGALIGMLTDLHPAVLTTAGAMTALAVGMRRAGSAAGALRFAFGPLGLVIGTAATALAAFSAGSTDTSAGVQELTRRLQESNGVIDESIRKYAAMELAEGGALEAFDALGISAKTVTDAFLGNEKAAEQVRSKLTELKDNGEINQEVFDALWGVITGGNEAMDTARNKTRLLAEANEDAGDSAENAGGQFEAAASRSEQWADAQEKAAERTEAAEEAYDEARQALEDYKNEIAGAVSPVTDYLDAQDAARTAQEEYNDAVSEFGPDSRQARDALFEMIDAENKAEAAAVTLRTEVDNVRESLKEDFEAGRISEQDYERAMTQLDDIDKKIDDTADPREVELRTEVDETKREADDAKLDETARKRRAEYISHREPQSGTETNEALDRTAQDRTARFKSSVARRLLGETDTMLDGVAKQRSAEIAPFAAQWRRNSVSNQLGWVARGRDSRIDPFSPSWRRNSVSNQLGWVARGRDAPVNANKGSGYSWVDEWLNWLARDRTATVNTRVTGPGFAGHYATGGLVGGARSQAQGGGPRGQDVLVGEQGPEIAQLPLGTRVIPSGQSRAMSGGSFGGGSAGPSKVELVIDSSGSRMDDMLLELLRRAIRVRGGNVQLVLGRN